LGKAEVRIITKFASSVRGQREMWCQVKDNQVQRADLDNDRIRNVYASAST